MSASYEQLVGCFRRHIPQGICLAYSGGVDSTLLLRAALDAQKAGSDAQQMTSNSQTAMSDTQKAALDSQKNTPGAKEAAADSENARPVLAVILETQLHPHSDIEIARSRAVSLGADCLVLKIDELEEPEILRNPPNRCYLCKKLLFTKLLEAAHARGYHTVFDGTNKDDEKEYRPGMAVLQELNIISPLRMLGITKQRVRELSRDLGLSTASMPSTPCMATRLPYGTAISQPLLQRLHQGEEALRGMGFHNVRLRFHAPVLRIEIDLPDFPQLLAQRADIVALLKQLDFPYLTLDLEGFRSGSMDLMI